MGDREISLAELRRRQRLRNWYDRYATSGVSGPLGGPTPGGGGGGVEIVAPAGVIDLSRATVPNLLAKMTQTKAHAAECRILGIGHSVMAGHASGALWTAGRANSFLTLAAAKLAAAGIPATAMAKFGDANTAVVATWALYDPEIAISGSWANTQTTLSTYGSLGAHTWANTTAETTNTLTITPADTWDTAEIFYVRNGGLGKFVYQIDAAGYGAPIDTAGTAAVLSVITTAGAPGLHSLTFKKNTTAGVLLVGVVFSNSALCRINLMNAGWGNGKIADFTGTPFAYSEGSVYATATGAAAIIFDETINDWPASTPLATLQSLMHGQFLAARAGGADPILIIDNPIGTIAQATIDGYVAGMLAQAHADLVPTINLLAPNVTFAQWNAAGFMQADQVHLTFGASGGEDYVGGRLATFIQAVWAAA